MPGFLDYRVPVASDMPMIEPILVEVPNPAPSVRRQGRRRGQHRAADAQSDLRPPTSDPRGLQYRTSVNHEKRPEAIARAND